MNTRLAAFASAVLVAAAGSAAAGLDATISNGNIVKGTLAAPTAAATFRVTCPAGAALTVTVKGLTRKGGATPAATFVVRDPAFAVVGADRVVATKTGASAKAIPLTATGTYQIVVSATGGTPGEFQLAATWKSPAPPPVAGTLAGGESTFDFAADAGATASFDVSQAARSKALPRLVECTGPDFDHVFAPAAAGSKRHRATNVTLPTTGVYTLHVVDGGTDGGAFRGKIAVKPPKPVKTKVVLTDAVLGVATDQFAQVATIGKEGGVAAAGLNGVSPIDGASVSIGAGALTTAVSIVVGTGVPLPPQTTQTSAVGQTVVFGPEGLKFTKEVTLTIPFDPSSFGGDFSGLKVFTRDAKGRIAAVPPPLTIDALAGTVSFPTSHFSGYRAFGPKKPVPGDLNGDGFADLVLPAPGDDAGTGAVFVYFGRADFLGNPPTAPDATLRGVATEDLFGSAVATGDLNGDGTADLLVGAAQANGGVGRVHVFFGGAGFPSSTTDATLLGVASGSTGDFHFGTTIVVGDVTGDGVADAVVASPLASTVGFENGVVYVFRGGASFAPLASNDASVIALSGSGDQDHLGVALAVGDLDADGAADLAVGNQEIAELAAGRVHVFRGGATLASQTAGETSIDFNGTNHFDEFGDAIAIGDFNQDGVADLAVGAPFEDDAAASLTDVGMVHVFFGGTGFSGRGASSSDRVIRPGDVSADLFGSSLAAGNVTGDATTDLVATAPGYDAAVGDEGDLYTMLGGPTFISRIDGYSGFTASDQFGLLFQPVDLDGDGRAEVIASSPNHANGSGVVVVRFGPSIGSDRQLIFDGLAGQRLGGKD